MNRRHLLRAFPPVILTLVMACSEPAPRPGVESPVSESSAGAPAGAAASPEEPADRSARSALPGLLSIMAQLERDLIELSHGIWLEDHEAIAASAQAVAGHPTVPPDELERISEALGSDLPRFKSWDLQVHDRAVRLAEAADEGKMDLIQEMDSEMRAGCVDCHSEFRDRLRRTVR